MSKHASNIIIHANNSTPEIKADWESGQLTMVGDSYPENTFELFGPVIDWVEAYLSDGQRPLRLDLQLVYLNTSSVRAMMDIFDLLEAAHGEGGDVAVAWRYDRDNERVAELAEEFKEDCTFPFEIVAAEA
ncbi:MAG: biofilm regulation phosphoprotein SiaC [Candidatus Methylumidiphilus sp.]